jgi:hypothetical protein
MKYYLPKDYSVRSDQVLYTDAPSELIYQPYVYNLAEYFIKTANLKYVIDIGCGSAGKLKSLSNICTIIGFDSSVGVSMARTTIPSGEFIEHDLEVPLPKLDKDILEQSVIICSDVIEHLQRPDKLAKQLSELAEIAPFVIVSTPDRDRSRGWFDQGPPANPAHVMEWNGTEFVRFLKESGFSSVPFYGYTINTDHHCAKSTLVTVSGRHVKVDEVFPTVKVASIIHSFNEVDIIEEVVKHLYIQGVEVHVFDNWSTDGTWEKLQALFDTGYITKISKFPEAPSRDYDWSEQLAKTTEYAKTIDAEWIMHHDADELRVSPWQELNLTRAISLVDHKGYNAIDFTVLDFRFINNRKEKGWVYEQELNHFEFGRRPGHFLQIKCWKNKKDKQVDLATSGGHEATFDRRKVFPIKFLLKHYSLRNKKQAEEKVFKNRLPRFKKEQSKFGWHNQYNNFSDSQEINGWEQHTLIPWHPNQFYSEFLIERISGIGLVD